MDPSLLHHYSNGQEIMAELGPILNALYASGVARPLSEAGIDEATHQIVTRYRRLRDPRLAQMLRGEIPLRGFD